MPLPLFDLRKHAAADNISVAAAAIAFYALLAAFPAVSALVSIYGMVVPPTQVARHLAGLEGLLPDPAIQLLSDYVRHLTAMRRHHLGLGLALSLVVTVTSAHAGSMALINALTTIYRSEDRPHLVRRHLNGLTVTIGTLAFVAISLALITLAPMLVAHLPLVRFWRRALALLRWVILALVMVGALGTLYRHGPHRPGGSWRWASPGTAGATALWLVASAAFSLYVARLGSYSEIYGSVGAAVVLLVWFYLTAWAVLIGAELDAHPGALSLPRRRRAIAPAATRDRPDAAQNP